MKAKPIVILGYGNPSRGDDALAPRLLEQLEQLQTEGLIDGGFEAITDFQLQIEHTLDLQGRELALFVDASLNASAPFQFSRLESLQDDSYSSHALSPAAVLNVYHQVNHDAPPPAFLLAIPGYRFELGEPLSKQAEENLAQAMELCKKLLNSNRLEEWEAFLPESKLQASQ